MNQYKITYNTLITKVTIGFKMQPCSIAESTKGRAPQTLFKMSTKMTVSWVIHLATNLESVAT